VGRGFNGLEQVVCVDSHVSNPNLANSKTTAASEKKVSQMIQNISIKSFIVAADDHVFEILGPTEQGAAEIAIAMASVPTGELTVGWVT
jgi:hypothetical protein